MIASSQAMTFALQQLNTRIDTIASRKDER
jgi:hypothetical protein